MDKVKKIQKRKFKQMQPDLDLQKHKPLSEESGREQKLEQHVLENPNDSEGWIHLIQFWAGKDIEIAREKVKLALIRICFEEEKEKLNVWKCYLNLEYFYGDEDNLVRVFKEAINANQKEEIVKHLVSLYLKDNNFEKAQDFIKMTLKKSKNKKQAWLDQLEFTVKWRSQLKNDQEKFEQKNEELNEIMKRALQSLDKNEHVDFLTKYATLEYRFGDYEKGRLNFENILSNFSKKSEIWNLYLDMEIKYVNERDNIRYLFDKLCSLPWKEKVIKGFFKKYLNYEVKYGDQKGQEKVKMMAVEYVNKHFNQL